MAGLKISELVDGIAPVDADEVPARRVAGNVRLSFLQIRTWLATFFDALGAAAAVIAAHLAAGDPHPQYALDTDLAAKQPNIQFQDEGGNIGTSGGATAVNFTGAGVTASFGAGTVTVNVPAGGSGSVDVVTTTFTLPYANVLYGEATVVDANITALSQVAVWWGNVIPADENNPDMDDVTFTAVPGAGSMIVRVCTANALSRVGGIYRINYLIG